MGTVAAGAYRAFMVTLFWVGMVLLNGGYGLGSTVDDVPYATTPVASKLMASAAVSDEEFLRRNPKWSKASNGPDRGK